MSSISAEQLQRLRDSEEKYRKMIEMANDAIFNVDPDTAEIVEINPRAEQMTGRTSDELIGLKVWEMHPRDEWEQARSLFNQVVQTGQGNLSRLNCLRPDGSTVPMEVSASLITFGSGKIIQRICRDCTTRVEFEERRRQLHQFYQHILDLMPVGLGVKQHVNRNPEVVFENAKLKELFAVNDSEGKPIRWDDCECYEGMEVREFMEANGCCGVERKFPDGRALMFNSSYYRDQDNNWHEIQVVQDMSERRQLEDALKKSNEELEARVDERTRELREKQTQLVQAEKMISLGQLVAGVAHEVNTPVGALKSNNDLFRRSLAKISEIIFNHRSPEEIRTHKHLRQMVDSITGLNEVNTEAVNRIVKIVDSLRSFARLDRAEMDRIDIHEGLESTLTLVHHEFKNRIEVIRQFGQVPRIRCYPNQINQVLMNLLVNAGHAISGKGTITITTVVDNDMARIDIRDTGKGISAEDLPKIFDPGFTTKDSGVGTGLGLSIVRQIITEHKGKIEVESEPGKGTLFTLYLPIG